jgi:hypothetical protein
MLKPLLFTTAMLSLAASAAAQGPARLARCLHGETEPAEQKTRREQAIKVAQAINSAEVKMVGPMKPTYKRPEELSNVPALPPGFALQFNTDGRTYTFSIKDTLDRCNYAIFSDQEKFVYEATPLTGARVLPLATPE